MTRLTTLGEVLAHDNRFDWQHHLYLPNDEVWSLNTICAVSDESDLDGVPELAVQNGLSYALGIAATQDIVSNAKEQIPDVTLVQLLQAFLYYYDRDAFIDFSQ